MESLLEIRFKETRHWQESWGASGHWVDYYQYSYNEQGAGTGHPGGQTKIARVGGEWCGGGGGDVTRG